MNGVSQVETVISSTHKIERCSTGENASIMEAW